VPDEAYVSFLENDATSYQGYKIVNLVNHRKFYKLKKVNPKSNRIHQLMLCKYHKCQASFTKISNLIDHLNVHDNVKPFQCSTCHKGFVQFGNLRRHRLMCTNSLNGPTERPEHDARDRASV